MTRDIDKRWTDWARDGSIKAGTRACKYHFELLESLRIIHDEQRERLIDVAAEFDALNNDTDVARFRSDLDYWMSPYSAEYRRYMLRSFECEILKPLDGL